MVYLYVTTDVFEAETLIEDIEPNSIQEPKHKYYDLEYKQSENLAKRIGFNPMCSVEMNENVSTRDLDAIVTKLVKGGLYVATEINGNVLKYIPHDAEVREKIVKLAMQKDKTGFGADYAYYLLSYLNNPNVINGFGFLQNF